MSKLRKLSLLMSALVLAAATSTIAIPATGGAHGPPGTPRASTATGLAGTQAGTRYYNFRGTISAKSRGHWFQLHTTDNRSLRIYTSAGTHWDDCDWNDMNHGHHVYVRAYRSQGRWVASRMQNWNDWDHGRRDHGENNNGEEHRGGEHHNGNGGGDWDD